MLSEETPLLDVANYTDLEQTERERIIKQFDQLQSLQDRRIKENGLAYYIPNKWQQEAHLSEARTIIACYGNRSGKSTYGIVEIGWHCSGHYPDNYPVEKRLIPPVKAVIVVTNFGVVDRMLEDKVRQYFPRGEYFLRRTAQRHMSKIDWKNGSRVDILTTEMDDMAFESADWDIYWGDEPQKQTQFQAIMRGLVDREGRAILTFTPLIEPWMKDELMDKEDGVRVKVFTGSTYDNQFDINGNTILTKEKIEWLEEQLPDEVKETRIYGKFFHLKGVVYPSYDPMVHEYSDSNYQYPDPVVCVLDPHDRQPHHVIWAYVDRTDDVFIDDEMIFRGTLKELALAINRREKLRGYKITRRVIDPNFGRKNLVTTGRTVIEELGHSGCSGWAEADDRVDEGHMKVREYMRFNKKKPLDINNKPKVFWNRTRCPETIYSVKNLQFEEWRSGTDKDPKEKEKQKKTHGADDVRYLLISNPTHRRLTYDSKKYELKETPY